MMVYAVNGQHGQEGRPQFVKVQVVRKKRAQGVRRTERGVQNRWGHLHSGGEVAHRLILRREGTRTRITHRKGCSGSIGGAVYNKAKREAYCVRRWEE
jgi:hypothetical protein